MDLKKDTALKSEFKGLLVILFLVLSVSMIPSQNAEAASKKSKALKAYSQLLSKNTIKWGVSNKNISASKCKFSVIYLDNNSVPELLIFSNGQTINAEGHVMLYTYKNGKAKYVGLLSATSTVKYYKKKGVIISPYSGIGGSRIDYDEFSGTKLTRKLLISPWVNSSEKKYYSSSQNGSNNKEISKSEFNSKLRKAVGSKKATKVKTYKNTAANRKKYLK